MDKFAHPPAPEIAFSFPFPPFFRFVFLFPLSPLSSFRHEIVRLCRPAGRLLVDHTSLVCTAV